jgi:O-antigen/teichoic acid export membrane protein
VAAGSALQIASRVAVLGCGLALMGYLTRNLGLADYGRYALAVMLVNWAATSLALATGGALVRLVAGKHDGHRYAVSMLQLSTIAGVALGIAFFFAAGPIASALKSPGIADLLRILAIDLPLGAMAGIHLGVLTAQGRFLKNAGGVLAGWIFQLAAAVAFVEGGLGARGAAWAIVASGFAQLLLARAMSGLPIFSTERVPFSELWSQTRLLAAAQVALRVSQGMDLLAVKYFLGSPAVAGLYAGAQNIGFAALMLFQPTAPVVLQSLSKSRREENPAEAARVGVTFIRVSLIYGGALIALSVFSGEIAVFLLGSQFSESGPVLAVLLAAMAFRIQAVAGRTLLSAAGEKVSILIPLLLLIGLAAGGFALAIPAFGILGGAGVAAALALGTAIVSLRDGLRLLNLAFPWATLLRTLIAASATAAFAVWLRGFSLHVLIELTLATPLYAATLILLGEWKPTKARLLQLREFFLRRPRDQMTSAD